MKKKLAISMIVLVSFFSLLVESNASPGKLTQEINQLMSSYANQPHASYFYVTAGGLGEFDRLIQFRMVDSKSYQLFILARATIQKGLFLPSIKYSTTDAAGLDLKDSLNFKLPDQNRKMIEDFFDRNKIPLKTEKLLGVKARSGEKVGYLRNITSPRNFGMQEAARIAADYLIDVCGYDEMKDGLGGGVGKSPTMPSSILDQF